MKTIADLTEEQAIQLTKLIYPWENNYKSEIKFHYFDGWCDYLDGSEFQFYEDEIIPCQIV